MTSFDGDERWPEEQAAADAPSGETVDVITEEEATADAAPPAVDEDLDPAAALKRELRAAV